MPFHATARLSSQVLLGPVRDRRSRSALHAQLGGARSHSRPRDENILQWRAPFFWFNLISTSRLRWIWKIYHISVLVFHRHGPESALPCQLGVDFEDCTLNLLRPSTIIQTQGPWLRQIYVQYPKFGCLRCFKSEKWVRTGASYSVTIGASSPGCCRVVYRDVT